MGWGECDVGHFLAELLRWGLDVPHFPAPVPGWMCSQGMALLVWVPEGEEPEQTPAYPHRHDT